jgi:hypothetical protein
VSKFRNQALAMRKQTILIVLLFALLVIAMRTQTSSGKIVTTQGDDRLVANSSEWAPTGGLADLPGTDWAVLPYQTLPDIFAFCRSGRWELQSNTPFGGRYQVSGDRIVMKLDDGSTYADCRLSKRHGSEIYLKCGNDELHLRYHGKVDCK